MSPLHASQPASALLKQVCVLFVISLGLKRMGVLLQRLALGNGTRQSNMVVRQIVQCCLWLALVSGVTKAPAQDSLPPTPAEFSAADIEWFEKEVRPIFAARCASCHSERIGSVKGGLSLDNRQSILAGGDSGASVLPGNVDASLLVEAIRRESFEMPPEKPLNRSERLTLEEWVARGAPWPQPVPANRNEAQDWLTERLRTHWAWQPMRHSAVPVIEDDDWSRNSIDKFILNRLREEGLRPAPDCSTFTLLRRLSVDLRGLPPDGIAAHGKLAVDTTDDRSIERQIEAWLSSPEYGVHWGRHWLDLVRYAETLGHEFDFPLRHAWHYRDCVIDTFNQDVPYSRIVVEHLAGDLVELPRIHPQSGLNQSLVSTGFWWLGDSVHAPVDIVQDWATRVDNQIDVVSKTFMGMTVACARCHDHKFDAISMADYYGLAGIARSTRRQYALQDPHAEISKGLHNLSQQAGDADVRARTAYGRADDLVALNEWVEGLGRRLQELQDSEEPIQISLGHPLAILRAVGSEESGFSKRFTKLATEALAANDAYLAWESETELFADFSSGLPEGWRVLGLPSELPTPSFDWFVASGTAWPARHDVFSSQRLGREVHVVLQSPTIELTKPVVCLKLQGKSAQSAVVIDNLFMTEFHDLLFKDTRKPLDQEFEEAWVTHGGDLNKYVGHPVYLSLEDRGLDWFEISEVRMAERGPPASPTPDTVHWASQNFGDSTQLIRAIAERLRVALHEIATEDRPSKDSVMFVRGALGLAEQLGNLPPSDLLPLEQAARQLQLQAQVLPEPVSVLATSEGSARDAPLAVRGNPHHSGESVSRVCFPALSATRPPTKDSSGRFELAATLSNPQHPLTARVMVNRVWQHLMGRGLVHSPDNLGVLGGRPTHPELLDFLALEFIEHDWSIKWLVREIVTSRTYQLASKATETQRQVDPDGVLWSHRQVRRLTAESLRDSMLATVGSLDWRLAGPSIPVHLSDKMTGRGRPRESGPLDGGNRRSVYVEVRRNFLDPFLVAFDFPLPSTTVGDRTQSNVPAQALGMLNDPLVKELARRWSARSAEQPDDSQRARQMLERIFSRPASDAEVADCTEFIAGDPTRWQELAHVLLNSKEFLYIQ